MKHFPINVLIDREDRVSIIPRESWRLSNEWPA